MNNTRLLEQIEQVKTERNAVILAHNYQPPNIQDMADFTGDSLGLSKKASDIDADVIVFCGVRFMAETASILNPDKKVLTPDTDAGCPMAAMVDAKKVEDLKNTHPEAAVVSYVNSTAEVKAVSDVCCTSSNALEIVNSLSREKIIFVPDKHLGDYVNELTDKEIILYTGYCPTHVKILPKDITNAKQAHPDAPVVVHPECMREVRHMADRVMSTGGMVEFAKHTDSPAVIIATETGILHRLRKENPNMEFIPASERAVCPNMKKNSLKKVLDSLITLAHRVTVDNEVSKHAFEAINRMLEKRQE